MSELAPELNARLLDIEAKLAAAAIADVALSADIASLDSKQTADTAAIIAKIEASEAAVLLGQQALAASVGAAGETMKALQMNAGTKTLTVATGIALDTAGDGVLAPCAILFGCRPGTAGNTAVITNNNSFNSRGLEAVITSGAKIRLLGGSASNEQTITTGTAAWANGTSGLGAGIWNGSSWTIIRDGVVDTTATETTRAATPTYGDDLRFNDDDDDHDLWAPAYIRGALSVAQVVAIQAKITAGDLTGAAADINGYNAAAGMLVGPTADDDPTTAVNGVVEWCAARATLTSGSPALIDIPA